MGKVIVIRYPNGEWAGSPAFKRTRNVNLAGCYSDRAEAEVTAQQLGNGAEVVTMENPAEKFIKTPKY